MAVVTTVRVLGPIEVWDGERRVELGGPRQVSLLALLVLTANRAVTTDALIDALWREADVGGRKRLQVAVRRLRQVLAPVSGGERLGLETVAGGYLLRLDRAELDSELFAAGVAAGRAALRTGEFERARECLVEALALWRGPPLAEVGFEDFARPEIRRLEELRVSALESRIDADLQLGRDAELVAELEMLVSEEPVRERLAGQLMTALYRCGRQADALDVYQRTRMHLAEQLGLEPGPALRELQTQILEHDPALELSPRAAPAPMPGSVGSLPVPATPFLGRAQELIEVTTLLQDSDTRLLTLTGAGGSGKTRLAVRAAEVCAADYRDGGWFVRFADITDPELIAPAICETLELAEHLALTPSERLQDWLRDRQLLLVLDNLEQLVSGSAVLGQLITACPGLRLLVTSREPLRLAGEQQYEVPVLGRADAIELFISRARAVAPKLTIQPELLGTICERLDYLPLAIELAAARTKAVAPAEIFDRLDKRVPVLTAGPRDAPRRQQTLRATIDWSYDLLADPERRLFVRLAVFVGGCTLAAAEAICEARLDTLHALVDKSLLRADGDRYRMLQMLREYALEKLDDTDEAPELRYKHARWYAEVLCDVDAQKGDDRRPPVDELAPDLENLRTAVESAESVGDAQTVARLATPLSWFVWAGQVQLNEADRWLRLACERLPTYPLLLQAQVLSAGRDVAVLRGDYERAAVLCDRALAIHGELGDPGPICRAMMNRGRIAAEQGDFEADRAMLEQAIQFARQHDVQGFLPGALVNLGDLAIEAGQLEEARALCEESIAHEKEQGASTDTIAVTVALINLAHVANLQGRHSDAADLGRQAFRAAIDGGDRLSAAAAASQIAWPLAEQGKLETSGWLLGAAIAFTDNAQVTPQRTDVIAEKAAFNALRDQLDEPTVQALFLQGRRMSLEDAARAERAARGVTSTPAGT